MKNILLLVLIVLNAFHSSAQVTAVKEVVIVVSEMDRSLQFYTEVLGFEKQRDIELAGEYWEKLFDVFGLRMRVVQLKLGDERIELIDYLTAGGRNIPEEVRSNDLSFQHIAIVVSDMDSAYEILRKHKVTHVSTGPQTLPASIPEAAGIKAFYFRDPDRHNLELIYFPKGKGQERWQLKTERIFLGIDHTAIGIGNTKESHEFYEGVLGVEKKGESWNKGEEQAHLNNIENASLHITGYRSPKGPGIEFLEYLSPGPGKAYPPDTRADDLWNWFTKVQVKNVEEIYKTISQKGKYKLVSKALLHSDKEKAFVMRDPDGHAVWIVEEIR